MRAIAGDIAALGLEDWWFRSFSESEREWMADTYSPFGISVTSPFEGARVVNRIRPLVEGWGCDPSTSRFKHLSLLATWFSRPGYERCALSFLAKAMEFLDDDLPVLDRHFALANHCQVFYRWRNEIPGALEQAISSCEACIAINEAAAAEAKAVFGIVPAHACFRQLRIIEEKRGNFDRAIALCEQAKAGGWADDWDHVIGRLNKKKAKSAAK